MKKTVALVLITIMLVSAGITSGAAINESAILNLLEEISQVSDDQLVDFTDILGSYLKNDTTIQNFSDDIGLLYGSVLTEAQRQKLSDKGISVGDLSTEILRLKGWEDANDYSLLVSAVSKRDNVAIKELLIKHGIVSESSSGESAVIGGGGAVSAPEEIEVLPEEIEPAKADFADIKGHWAQDNIQRLYALGIITGRDDQTFDPDSGVTRAEFLTMLVRILKLDQAEGDECPFVDIEDGQWFKSGVTAAFKAGLAKGNEDGTFAPERKISRQEMAVMADNAISYMNENGIAGIDITEAFEKTFVDIDEIDSWALEAMKRLNGIGLINGDGQALRPEGGTTRAEAATVLMRLIDVAGI